MEPVPFEITKTYPARGPLQQFRLAESAAFRCFRCGETKKSKLITLYGGDWARRLCNGCYGRLLSLYEIKTGGSTDEERAEALADALSQAVAAEQLREAERLFRASEERSRLLTHESVRFISTAEHVAAQLDSKPQLEWSPAIICLCKAVETEVVSRILIPLAGSVRDRDLQVDRADKDVSSVASFCADSSRKPPELGAFAYFLQTCINSQERRQGSTIIQAFLRLVSEWTGSSWLLDRDGLHRLLVALTTAYRNRAAHIEELGKDDYLGCRSLVIGEQGLLWRLVVSTSRHDRRRGS